LDGSGPAVPACVAASACDLRIIVTLETTAVIESLRLETVPIIRGDHAAFSAQPRIQLYDDDLGRCM
jgi:hypothetical protein